MSPRDSKTSPREPQGLQDKPSETKRRPEGWPKAPQIDERTPPNAPRRRVLQKAPKNSIVYPTLNDDQSIPG